MTSRKLIFTLKSDCKKWDRELGILCLSLSAVIRFLCSSGSTRTDPIGATCNVHVSPDRPCHMHARDNLHCRQPAIERDNASIDLFLFSDEYLYIPIYKIPSNTH